MDERYSVDTTRSAWRMVDGEVVIINAETTYYYSLNETGSQVWKLLLEHELTLDEIARALASAYGVVADTARDDVRHLVEQLREELLVAVASGVCAEPFRRDGVSAVVASGAYAAPELLKYDTLEELVVSGE